jgi:hypothetical protein
MGRSPPLRADRRRSRKVLRLAAPTANVYDYHVHTPYSDGEFPERMARAAADPGPDGVGCSRAA